MIVEGVLTTCDSAGRANVAAMGVLLDEAEISPDGSWKAFCLRPFEGSRTYANLRQMNCGVFHLTDDVGLLARAALGDPGPVATVPGTTVRCPAMIDCVRAFEFEITSADWSEPRANLQCRVTQIHRRRDWIGWNRAQHAVLELTISATRVKMLPRETIESQIRQLSPLIEKTAGAGELAAWEFVLAYLSKAWLHTEQASGSGANS
ncbi:DUF447 family protein [bacterium]|nr:DUF447 family protein [bacterium]